MLLTGELGRWEKLSAVWRQSWRSMHQPDHAEITAEFLVQDASQPWCSGPGQMARTSQAHWCSRRLRGEAGWPGAAGARADPGAAPATDDRRKAALGCGLGVGPGGTGELRSEVTVRVCCGFWYFDIYQIRGILQ